MQLKSTLAYLLLPIGLSSSAPTKDTSRPIVDLGYAKYQGVSHGSVGVDEYLGIRFAAPPTGNNRWRAPQDPLKESKIQDASQVCTSSFQPIFAILLLTLLSKTS